MPVPTPPTIPYASRPTIEGVSIEHDAHHLRIVVPPTGDWRRLARSHGTAVIILVVLVVIIVGVQVSVRNVDWMSVIFSVVIYGSIIALILFGAVIKLRRWTTFIVTAERFFVNKRIFSPEGETVSWPRGAIAGAKFVEFSNRVSIRVYGRDPIELSLGQDPATSRHIAHVLDDALHGHFEPMGHANPVRAAQLASAQTIQSAPPKALNVIMSVILGAVVVAAIIFPPLACGLAVAAIPLGLYFGTQKKDYYI